MPDPIIIPRDFDSLRKWFDMLRHTNMVIVRGSNQWLEIGVFIDKDGTPQFWQVSEPHNLSPKNREVEIKD
jgi:hypothetical protein